MIIRRTQSQIKRLRDLMSEVQENHTRIQKLWKKVDDAQLIWPVGIAAAPPIDGGAPDPGSETSSSSSSSETSSSVGDWTCDNCTIPTNLILNVTKVSGTTEYPCLNLFIGDNALSYHSESYSGGDAFAWWMDDCVVADSGCWGGLFLDDPASVKLFFQCQTGGSPSISIGSFNNSSSCELWTGVGSFGVPDILSCSPFHARLEFTYGGSLYVFEITE